MSVREAVEKGVGTAVKAKQANALNPQAVSKAAGLQRTEGVIREAADAGVGKVADGAEDAARRATNDVRKVEEFERTLRDNVDRSRTTLSWMRRLRGGDTWAAFTILWHSYSEQDRHRIIRKMIDLFIRDKKVTQNFVAGAVRELMAKELKDVRKLVLDTKREIAQGLRGTAGGCPLDTGTMGDVFLRTKVRKDTTRGLELGTDRFIGVGHGSPRKAIAEWSDGTTSEIEIQGRFQVLVAIEVKGRTTVEDGAKQILNLVDEGRATGGYVVIDRKVWILDYKVADVHHVIIAPPGYHLDRLDAMKQLEGRKLTVFRIPTELDDMTKTFADRMIADVRPIAAEIKKETAARTKAAKAAAKTPG